MRTYADRDIMLLPECHISTHMRQRICSMIYTPTCQESDGRALPFHGPYDAYASFSAFRLYTHASLYSPHSLQPRPPALYRPLFAITAHEPTLGFLAYFITCATTTLCTARKFNGHAIIDTHGRHSLPSAFSPSASSSATDCRRLIWRPSISRAALNARRFHIYDAEYRDRDTLMH